jgi:hypothetical protein
MSNNKKDWNAEALEDAWDMVDNFFDEILEQAIVEPVSNDLFNDYESGDSYHCENNQPSLHNLVEAAEILDQLDDYEESDWGLWESYTDPKEAVCIQASYTVANAVMHYWGEIIKEINEFLDMWEWNDDAERKEDVTKFLTVHVSLNYHFLPEDCDGMIAACLKDVRNLDWTSTLVLCDWLDEHETHSDLVKKLRELLS